jgi:hypothetical protein
LHIQRLTVILAAWTAIVLFSVVTAKADSVTFTIGNNPQPDEENILLNNGTTGAVVFGVTNQTQLQVRFSSTTDVLVEPSSGQARIEATDGLLNNITISIPGGTFHDIILNPFFGSGTANVSVLTTNATFSFAYQLSNGQNFLTIVADPGTLILSVTINAASGFTDLRQPRISGAAVTAVPEPASMVLFGIGLIGTATQLLKRRRHLS